MIQRALYTITSTVLLLFLLSSCDRLLEVKPEGSVDANGALDTKEMIEAGTTGAYSFLRKTSLYGRKLIAYPELLADNAVQSGRTSNLVETARNNVNSGVGGWRWGFSGVAQCNVVLDALDNYDGDQEWKDQQAGQLYFLRALYFFNLARVYSYDPTAIESGSDRGSVPLVLKAVKKAEDIEFLERAPIPDLYEQLYKDLDSAYKLLENTQESRAPHFATQGAVAALYTRVALYNGDYEKVVDEAEKAIDSKIATFSTTESYVDDWRKETHPESMFEVKFTEPDNIGVNSSLQSTFTTHASVLEPDLIRGNGYAVVSDDLYDQYDDSDVRKDLIWKGLGYNSDKHEMTKFMSRGGVMHLDNVPVIRISEVYLNRAEAYAHIDGDDDLAMDDLNKIRERAGLSPVSGLSEDILIDAIVEQRRLEFAFEGDRWFDLKRLGRDVVKPDGTVIPHTDYRILARIPYRNTNASAPLKNNPGY